LFNYESHFSSRHAIRKDLTAHAILIKVYLPCNYYIKVCIKRI